MILSALSCSSGTEAEQDIAETSAVQQTVPESVPETEEPDYLASSLPETDLAGESIRLIGRSGSGGRINFPEDTFTGEAVNDALYTRNEELTKRYNVKIVNNSIDQLNDLMTLTSAAITAGDDAYEAIFADMADTARTLTLNSLLIDYSTVPYVDLSQHWWSKYNGDLSIGGKLFFPTGVITPQYFSALFLMLFNRQLADDYGIEDLYEVALEGNWTLDKMRSVMESATLDLNGDGKMDLDDRWSLVYDEVAGYAFYFGVGGKMTEFDEEGMPYLDIGTDQVIDLVEHLRSIVGDKEKCLRGEDYYKNAEQTVFKEGRALLVANTLHLVRTVYREMENDYGFLPMPKYDENQKEYLSYAQPWSGTGVAIPITNTKLGDTGLILEAMAYLSDSYVRDSMFETTYKEKLARDERTARILDIIADGARFDLNVFFNWGNSAATLRDAVMGNNTNYASSYAKIQKTTDKTIEKLCETIREMGKHE
jgi:hypothetical protein